MVLSTTKEEINMSSHKDAVSQIVDTLNKSAAKPKLDMQVKEQFWMTLANGTSKSSRLRTQTLASSISLLSVLFHAKFLHGSRSIIVTMYVVTK